MTVLPRTRPRSAVNVLTICLVSVSSAVWFSEEQAFAIGFTDGKIVLATRDPERPAATIDACQSKISQLAWDPTGTASKIYTSYPLVFGKQGYS